MKFEITTEEIRRAPIIIQKQHCPYSDRDDNFTLYYPDISINPNNEGEIYKRMISNLVDFIYDIARLDKLETDKQKKFFLDLVNEKLSEKIMSEE